MGAISRFPDESATLFRHRHGSRQAEIDARFARQRGRLAARQQHVARARRAAHCRADACAFSAARDRADDRADGCAAAYLGRVLTVRGLALLRERLRLHRDVLSVGETNAREHDRQRGDAGHLAGLHRIHNLAFHARAAFGDDKAVRRQRRIQRAGESVARQVALRGESVHQADRDQRVRPPASHDSAWRSGRGWRRAGSRAGSWTAGGAGRAGGAADVGPAGVPDVDGGTGSGGGSLLVTGGRDGPSFCAITVAPGCDFGAGFGRAALFFSGNGEGCGAAAGGSGTASAGATACAGVLAGAGAGTAGAVTVTCGSLAVPRRLPLHHQRSAQRSGCD